MATPTAAHLSKATLRVGLSWPSLAKALGRTADPKKWGVLYLGSAKAAALAPGREIVAVSRKGAVHPDGEARLLGLEGVVRGHDAIAQRVHQGVERVRGNDAVTPPCCWSLGPRRWHRFASAPGPVDTERRVGSD